MGEFSRSMDDLNDGLLLLTNTNYGRMIVRDRLSELKGFFYLINKVA